jgi:hypothetical protein
MDEQTTDDQPEEKYSKLMNVSVSLLNGKFQAAIKLADGTQATSKAAYANPEEAMEWALDFASEPRTVDKLESTSQYMEPSE